MLPNFRDKESMEAIQIKGSGCPDLLIVQPEDRQLVHIISLQHSSVSNFMDKDSSDQNPTTFSENNRVSPYLLALNPSAHSSFLLINVLCGFFFPNKEIIFIKTCSAFVNSAAMNNGIHVSC